MYMKVIINNYRKHTPNEKRVYVMNDGRKRSKRVTVKHTLATYYDLCSE